MTNNMRRAYTEVDAVLGVLPNEYVEKIPQKLKELFKTAKLEDYIVHIDVNKPVDEQNFVYETLAILTLLRLNYWCKSEEEKNNLIQLMQEKDNSIVTDFNTAINLNIENKSQSEIKNNLLIEVKHNQWFYKIIAKIKNLFKKK